MWAENISWWTKVLLLGNFHANSPRSAQAKEATSILGCSLPATAAGRPDSQAPLSPMINDLLDVKGLSFVKKNRILVQSRIIQGLPGCLFFWLFSCPWVDWIYCDDYVTTKIESKCRRREILFLCVWSQRQRRTQVVGRIHPESSGMCSYNECKSNASLGLTLHFDSSFIHISIIFFCCWWMSEDKRRVDESSHRCVWIATRQVATTWHQPRPHSLSLQTLCLIWIFFQVLHKTGKILNSQSMFSWKKLSWKPIGGLSCRSPVPKCRSGRWKNPDILLLFCLMLM